MDGSTETPAEFTNVTLPDSGSNVQGRKYPLASVFHNIKYAESPEGNLRFRDPVPFSQPSFVDASNGDRIMCPQQCVPPFCQGIVSEDCLVLTVYVPSSYSFNSQNGQLLPVMFFIHGGGFYSGSSNEKVYDAAHLSNTTNTIIVKINYRLGLLGFLTDDKSGISGNQGIKDQRLAMKWVQDNIAAFGGDKDQVTIFGESAGAQSVQFHLLSKESQPYYQRAIIQSCLEHPYPDRSSANKITEGIVNHLKLTFKCQLFHNNDECLRRVSYQDLIDVIRYRGGSDEGKELYKAYIGAN
jgi:carboxylesterase type B